MESCQKQSSTLITTKLTWILLEVESFSTEQPSHARVQVSRETSPALVHVGRTRAPDNLE